MKKRLFIILIIILVTLFGCYGHKHEFINGLCECGERHNCEFIDGICECGKTEEIKLEEYVITFNNSDLSQVKVNKGDKLIQPADPVKEGYIFRGWYLDSECTKSYDFDSVVNSNIELYAKWIEYTKVINNNENISILDKNYINENKDGNSISIDNNIKLIYSNDLSNEQVENLYFTGTEEEFRNIKIYGDFNANVYINNELINFDIVSNKDKDFSGYDPESLVTIEVVIYLNNEIKNTIEIKLPINSKLTENCVIKIISSAEVLNSWNGLGQCFVTLYADENKEIEFDLNYFNNISKSKKIFAFFEEKYQFDEYINGTYSTDNNDVCVFENKKLTIYGNEYLLNDEYIGKKLSHFSYSDGKAYIEVKINGYYLRNELVISILDEITGERVDNLFIQTESIKHIHEFGEWVVVKEATEEEAGLKERSCSCGEKETETVEKLGNSIESGFTLPNDGCEIREFHCAYRSMKTEYDIDNVTLDFYYGGIYYPDIEYQLNFYDIPLFELYFKEAGGEKYLIKRVEENFISKKYYCDVLEDGEYNINIIFNYSESITIPKEIFTKDSGLLFFQIYGKSIGKLTLENDYIAGKHFYYKVIGEKVLISNEPLK